MRKIRNFGLLCAAALGGVAIAGCAAADRPVDVPQTAMNKAEGPQKLVYTASEPGTVWISEGPTDIVYSAPVAAGDRVVVDPSTNKILVNGQVVLGKDVNPVDHTVFFLAGAAPPPPAPNAVAASDMAVNRPAGVPMTAQVAGEGSSRVEYTAARSGFIWITDVEQHLVIYSAPVNQGDVVAVDPLKNQLTINGQSVYTQTVAADDHRIFFSTERPVMQVAPSDAMIRPAEIPADATNRIAGTGRMDFTPERDGSVWVADVTTGRTIYTGRILTGDHLTLDSTTNLLTLNGRPVRTEAFASGDRYSIFFAGQ